MRCTSVPAYQYCCVVDGNGMVYLDRLLLFPEACQKRQVAGLLWKHAAFYVKILRTWTAVEILCVKGW